MVMSMAQTTPLIRGIFDEVFADQIDASAGSNKSKVWIKDFDKFSNDRLTI